jgi:hypothetical protein
MRRALDIIAWTRRRITSIGSGAANLTGSPRAPSSRAAAGPPIASTNRIWQPDSTAIFGPALSSSPPRREGGPPGRIFEGDHFDKLKRFRRDLVNEKPLRRAKMGVHHCAIVGGNGNFQT